MGFELRIFSKARKIYLSSWSLFLFAKIPVYPLPDESLEFDLKLPMITLNPSPEYIYFRFNLG